MLGWRFPRLDGGDSQGINNSGIATFKGSDLYDNLAREICQNSLDAKVGNDKPVIVEFKVKKIPLVFCPEISSLKEIIDNCREYWSKMDDKKLNAFLDEADSKFSNDIEFLVISDYNTKGLSGAKAGERDRSVWRALTHSSGVTDKDSGSGGSYGIGKNAPFACSSFRTVFYNSYSKDDKEKAFQGVARLVTHSDKNNKNESTQGVGFYQNLDNKEPIFSTDECRFRDEFFRDEYGTDVIIAGFKKNDTWLEDIEKAVLSNFFVAIYNEKLIVKIEGREINKKSIFERIEFYSNEELKNNNKGKISTIKEYYECISNPDDIKYCSILESNDITVYLKKSDDYSRIIAYTRSIGMLVKSRKNTQSIRYAAVVYVTGEKMNEILKSIEPPQHNKWDVDLIDDEESKKHVTEYYRSLIKNINEIVKDFCHTNVPDEINLDGLSEYLPYDEDDLSFENGQDESDLTSNANSKNNDYLDTNTEIGEPKLVKPVSRNVKLSAHIVKGEPNNNIENTNENTGGNSEGKSGGVENPDSDESIRTQGDGDKLIKKVNVLDQRIIQCPGGMYKILFRVENSCKELHISVNAIGDDGNKESIVISSYKYKLDKGTVRESNLNNKEIILNDIVGNKNYELFVEFEYSERMLLNLMIN